MQKGQNEQEISHFRSGTSLHFCRGDFYVEANNYYDGPFSASFVAGSSLTAAKSMLILGTQQCDDFELGRNLGRRWSGFTGQPRRGTIWLAVSHQIP